MRDWASSGGAKIERAKELIAEFERGKQSFLKDHPYSASSRFNAEEKRGQLTFVVNSNHVVPARLAAIAADAIHNLRAALDILWNQAWTKGNSDRRKQYFPLVRDAKELEARFQVGKANRSQSGGRCATPN